MKEQLIELQKICLDLAEHPLQQRLQQLCKHFLGTAYGPWQDGTSLESLDDFNYQLKVLDCVTFVEVVLALAKTRPISNLELFIGEFESILRSIHYASGTANFISRNHFMCCDWIPNNKFMVEDITTSLSPNYKNAVALIDKLAWVQHHPIMSSSEISPEQTAKLQPITSNIPYIESNEFLNSTQHFINLFPDYSIVNIVRPNWDLTGRIGTHLNISHLGFAFKDRMQNDIIFYHATSEKQIVVQETLPVYLRRFIDSPTIRGFDVLVISPGYHHGG